MARAPGLGPRGFAALEDAADTFERLQNHSNLTVEEPGEGEEVINWLTFSSTRVAEAGYDSQTERLFVRWVKPGLPYVYEGVPRNVWRNFRRSVSAGKFVNRTLNGFDYHPLR